MCACVFSNKKLAPSVAFEIAVELLKKKANILEVDEYGYAPLHYAAENGMLEVVNTLIEVRLRGPAALEPIPPSAALRADR